MLWLRKSLKNLQVMYVVNLEIIIRTINMIMKKIFTNHTKLIKAYENINFHTLVLIYSDNISKASFAISWEALSFFIDLIFSLVISILSGLSISTFKIILKVY